MGAKTVAIACQGGGSHTAFTAGVLSGLLTHPKYGKTFTITALSGTSGGALCAGLVWSRLVRKPGQGPAGHKAAAAAAEALQAFWKDIAADDSLLLEPWLDWTFNYASALSNRLMVTAMRANPFAEQQCRQLSHLTPLRMLTLLERHLPVAELKGKALNHPALRIGATDIRAGATEPIAAEKHPVSELHKLLLASASIPPLFPPTVLDGKDYWDGLYSHNPPLDCFTDLKAPPEEIWVIQINPERCAHAPRTARELVDRRNELMGNLTLAAELYHLHRMNWLLTSPKVGPAVKLGLRGLGYRPITLRLVHLQDDLDLASKYDRSLLQMEQLMEQGKKAAHEFFEPTSKWPRQDMSGVHNARLEPPRKEHNGAAKVPWFTFCTTLNCPAISICNSSPLVDLGMEAAFKTGQKYLEFKAKPEAKRGEALKR